MGTKVELKDKPPLVARSSTDLDKVKKPRIVIRHVAALAHSVTLEMPEEGPRFVAIAEPVNTLVDLSRNLETAIAVANGARRTLSAVADILPAYTNEYWKQALDSVPVVHVPSDKL